MLTHEFIEYKNGKYKLIKRFYDYSSCIEKKFSLNILQTTILTTEDNHKELAHNYISKNKINAIEGYPNLDRIFTDCKEINTSNLVINQKRNFQFWSFNYPLKYKNYKFYTLECTEGLEESKKRVWKIGSKDELCFMNTKKKLSRLVLSN